MAVDLDRPAGEVDLASGEYAAMLAGLQANILRAHGRDFARHIFIRFTAGPPEARAWIRAAAESVTSAGAQLEQTARHRANPSFTGDPVTSLYLSASGYAHLGLGTEDFASRAFRRGMKDRRAGLVAGLVDRLLDRENKDPAPSAWEPGFRGEIHALIALADDDAAALDAAATATRTGLAGVADVLTEEQGAVLRRTNPAGSREPVEHFGYFDGISNPLFSMQDLGEEPPENQARVAWDAGAPLSLVLAPDPHAPGGLGSYLVYRKLGQDVAAFEQRMAALASALGTTEELAGAMTVGRFKDGTPVLLADRQSEGPEVANDFTYKVDPAGTRCPLHAHVRKVNPRGTTPIISPASERRHRIVRRGIPYGAPLPGVADDGSPSPGTEPSAPRGLLFLCFQRSIEDQFEFIQRTWVDNEHFPSGVLTLGLLQHDTGADPLIGQERDEAQRWPKVWGRKAKRAVTVESAVTLRGGEYFFAPSIAFLRSV